jgi:hypothetical protein
MIPFNAKQIAIAAAVVLLFISGWMVRGWYEGSKDATRLEAEENNRELMVELANKVSASTETAIQGIRIENRTIYNEVQKEIVANPVYRDCVLSDAGVRAANQARRGAATGKSNGAVSGAVDSSK